MISSQRELKKAIFQTKEKLKEKEIFLSNAYDEFLTQMQHGVTSCTHLGNSHLQDMGENGAIAYTDGNDTYINYNSVFTKGMKKLEKHKLFCGLNIHECGHLLFTDFNLNKKVLENLEKGVIYPAPIQNQYLEEVEKFLKDGYAGYIIELFHKLDNCIEDGLVDRAVMKITPGYASCLRYVLSVDKATENITYSDLKAKKVPEHEIFTRMVLEYARHGELIYEDGENDELIDAFEEIKPVIRQAVFEASPLLRKKKVFLVFCYLFHFVQIQQQQNQQSQGSQGQPQNGNSGQGQPQQNNSGNGSQNQNQSQNTGGNSSSGSQPQQNNQSGNEQGGQGQNTPQQNSGNGSENGNGQQKALQEILKELGAAMANSEKNEHKNTSAPKSEDIKNATALLSSSDGTEEKKQQEQKKRPENDPTFEKIASQVAESKVSDQQERELQAQNACDVKAFLDGVSVHANVSATFERQKVTPEAKRRYEKEHGELDSIVRRFVSEFEKEIKERQIGDTLTGLYTGKRFTAREAHRFDKKVFNRKILPEDIPDMAIGIMVDLSGSMSGVRVDTAIKTAYITYCFCRRLNIPVFVIGHSTGNRNVILNSVVDDRSLDSNDKYRIFGMHTYSCNRDGFALRYCLKRLEHMQADQKLMFIISDGMPNHDGYGMQAGRKDCQSAIADAMKKGIFTITAGIGDASSVKAVYKEDERGKELSSKASAAFLDLTDLKRLPKSFVKIIKDKLS